MTIEFNRKRTQKIRRESAGLAKKVPLQDYLRLSEEEIASSGLYPSHACTSAEDRYSRVLKGQLDPVSGNIIDPLLQKTFARVRKVSVVGLKTWVPNAPSKITKCIIVKNPEQITALHTYTGDTNALLTHDGVAFIAHLILPNVVHVVRPVMGEYQHELKRKFEEITGSK